MSLYERLGGAPALRAATDEFYVRLIADARVAHFFDGLDLPAQAAKQRAFLAFVTGGAPAYAGQALRAAHAPLVELGLNDADVDIVIEHLGATLADLGVPGEEIGEVAALAESVRDDVLGREPSSREARPTGA